MRELLTFICKACTLQATLDHAAGSTGLLIVSGGNEVRIGSHRGMATLARDIARAGHPVFRFDRRGIGDSEGVNEGFGASGPDIDAALIAFRAACPYVQHVVAFGNCDAATALILHAPVVDYCILANPWLFEPVDDLPPAAAIKQRYARRLRDPTAWKSLITGRINLAALFQGIKRIAMTKKRSSSLATRVAFAISESTVAKTIVLAARDNTAVAFADAWSTDIFAKARQRPDVELIARDTGSHSLAGEDDYRFLLAAILAKLRPSPG